MFELKDQKTICNISNYKASSTKTIANGGHTHQNIEKGNTKENQPG